MSAPYPILKARAWRAIVGGVSKFISVLSTEEVDLTSLRVGPCDFYETNLNQVSYLAGAIVQVQTSATVNGVTLTPGTYVARQYVPAWNEVVGGTPNVNTATVPQFPYPTPGLQNVNIYWILVALGPQQIQVCSNGSKSIFVNSSQPF